MDSAIQKVQEKMEYIAQDKEALRAYHMREMAIHDYASCIANAEKKGKIDVARNLLSLNIPMEIILKSTGLSLEEIEKLKTEI